MFDKAKFVEWLRCQGADVLSPTNSFELARFRAHGSVHVIYTDKSGAISFADEFSEKCIAAFKHGGNLGMGFSARRKSLSWKIKTSLLQRDGQICFFCQKILNVERMTIEHLVAVGKGGPNHSDNLVLSHPECNAKANNLPLIEKIKIHREAFIREGGLHV